MILFNIQKNKRWSSFWFNHSARVWFGICAMSYNGIYVGTYIGPWAKAKAWNRIRRHAEAWVWTDVWAKAWANIWFEKLV